jgi:type VI secretion system ImpC/EvpB family protein
MVAVRRTERVVANGRRDSEEIGLVMSAGSMQNGPQGFEPAAPQFVHEVISNVGGEQQVPADVNSTLEDRKASGRPGASLIDAILQSTVSPGSTADTANVSEFLAEPNLERALRIWADGSLSPGEQPTRQAVLRRLTRDLSQVDQLLQRQVNAILHHPRFQQLEASWRGLWMLTGQVEEAKELAESEGTRPQFEVRVLDISKRALARDFASAVEFDQSQIFKKVYEQGFGMAGGDPFGVLIGDYQFSNHPEDLDILSGMSGVAAAAFSPFIAAASPELLGLESFSSLEQPIRLTESYNQVEYIKWNAFRDSDDSRFVGLTLPRVLMRVPYNDDGSRSDGFRFREEVEALDRSQYLWGNAAYSLGSVVIRAFGASRWFADIRGLERGVVGGGLVTELPVHSFSTDHFGAVTKSSTEIALNDFQEKELSTLGFIPLCHCNDTEYSVFYTNSSVQKPKKFSEVEATTNAKISSMLQYILCASRFSHYLKVLARNKIGSQQSEAELERYLKSWIGTYVTADSKAPASVKAKFPLREAKIEVREIPGKPGSYRLVMHLLPHFQLDGLSASLRMTMKVSTVGGT